MFKSFKKVISTLAAVAMLATSASAFAVDFPDVDKSADYAGAVNTLTALGIVNGDENGKFNPENTVTRAEFTKMVVEAIGEGSAAASSSYTKFADAQGHWGAGYIETGVAKGFINGYDENSFGPDDQVTYAQAVKMLVAAIGYTTYAENNGGWPSGYLAYGSSLDIIAGVTGVSNDTALTRAQCAVLIANTLEAPICKIDGYDKDFQGNWYPNYTEMDGTGKNWQTLLTTQHDAYAVKGRVSVVDKQNSEVTYIIEAAENFEDTYYTAANAAGKKVKIGDTNAANMLFEYSEAIIQKDKASGKYTMVSIASYGSTETVEFAAADLSGTTFATGSDNTDTRNPGVISVKKDGTSKTTDYKISDQTAATAYTRVYVNGEPTSINYLTDTTYLASTNLRGTVTLVDETNTASTSTDGYYDRILVTYCDAAQVTSVKVADDSIRIRTDIGGTIEWDPTDTAKNVTITKDGVEISAEDVKEDDIVLISYDVVNASVATSTWVDIQVSDKTVSGTATGKSTTTGKEYLLVDGEKYKFNNASDITSIALNKAYTLYLDAMGYVYDYDVDEASKNIGIVAQMYQSAQDDTPTVVLIDGNGDVQTYLTKTTADAQKIENAVEGVALTPSFAGNYTIAKLKDDQGTLNQRFVEYRISGGKLVFEADVTPDAVSSGMFKTSTSKLGSYTIDETATTILDLDAYLNSDGDVAVYPYSSLENENTYTGFVADKNLKTGVYGFAVITNGTSSLRATSALAVVTSCGSMTSVDGVNVEALTVARDGEEDIEVLVRDMNAVTEGSIIMYTVGSDGYVETGKLKVIYKPYADYSAMATAMFADLTAGDLFTKVADTAFPTYIAPVGSPITGYTLDMANNSKVELYVAPVYSATSSVLQVFTGQATAGQSSIARETEAFSLAGANVYTYSYDKATGDGISVSVGGVTQRSDIFKGNYISSSDFDNVDWSAVLTDATNGDAEPMVAFVRVNDGDVTDVVYYIAD